MLQQLGIIMAALLGFILAAYIRHKRVRKEKLICFLGEDCNKVVQSKYAETFGISNEILGMLYYGITGLYYGVGLIYPTPIFAVASPFFLVAAGGAAVFSIYLVGVQTFILKEWCEWCLTSTGLSVIIFLLVL